MQLNFSWNISKIEIGDCCTFGESGDNSIKYGATKGLFQKCVFNRGWAPQPDIIYELNYDPSGKQYTDKFEIKDNTFNRLFTFHPLT